MHNRHYYNIRYINIVGLGDKTTARAPEVVQQSYNRLKIHTSPLSLDTVHKPLLPRSLYGGELEGTEKQSKRILEK
jgi:hypothetical protein